MAILFEGTCIGKPVNVELGDKNNPKVRWQMEVTQGPHTGKRANYSGKFDEKSVRWTRRDMVAIGWKGVSTKTFLADVAAANVEIEFEAQIAEHEGRQWTAAKMTGALPLQKLDEDGMAKVDRWLAEAANEDAPAGTREADIPF